MANAEFGDYGGYASHARPQREFHAAPPLSARRGPAQVAPRQDYMAAPDMGMAGPRLTRGQRMVNIAGALGSVALVVSLGYWGWELAVRDVRGVPVVRALEGPMRTAPEDGGGMVVDHQGLSVNDVAAKDGGAGSDRVVLAPPAVELTAEDLAGVAPLPVALAEAPSEFGATMNAGSPAGLAPVTRMSAAEESPLPTEVEAAAIAPAIAPEGEGQPATISQDEAVALALAEALGMDDTASAELVAAAAPATPAGAMASSPRPKLRPVTRAAAAAAPSNVTQTAAVAPAAGKDPATIEIGARLVQFGAYDSEALAQAEWQKIAAKLGPLMAEKQMVVQSAESGGHTFWRLRGFGFSSEDDARRFCSAAVAEQINCIPVTQR